MTEEPSNRLANYRTAPSILLILVSFITIFSCAGPDGKDEGASMEGSDAELAVIMRQIHEDAKALKTKIVSGEDLGDDLPGYLERIKIAEKTDPAVGGPVFEAFTETYIQNIEAIYADTSNLKQELFNEAIVTCVRCHGEFCPGPVKTIKKLRIN